jgi:uracil-DNA glycosylase family 4
VGFVPPCGPPSARLCAFGQGPGEQEAQHGVPFYEHAPAGGKVTEWWHAARLLRNETLFLNTVWCWLPKEYKNGLPRGNREPTKGEIKYCAEHHLYPYVEEHGLLDHNRLWVSLGTPATRLLTGLEGPIERYIGTFFKVEGLGHGRQ